MKKIENTSEVELFDQLSRAEVIGLVRTRLAAMTFLTAMDRYLILVRFMVDRPVSFRRLSLTCQMPASRIRTRVHYLKFLLQAHFADLKDAA